MMKTYISDIIPKIQRFSKRLDDLTLLTNQHWVFINGADDSKNVYIFRSNNELLISQNGRVEKAKWEYLGNDALLIDRKEDSFLFKHGFFDENILALKIDSKNEYAFLVNETRYDKELNTIDNVLDFLKVNYIDSEVRTDIHKSSGIKEEKPVERESVAYDTTTSKEEIYSAAKDRIRAIVIAFLLILVVIGATLIFLMNEVQN